MTRRTASWLIGLALLGGAGGLTAWLALAPPPELPDVAIADLDGDPKTLESWAGQIRVVNFWATWCKPCREEVPMLVAAQRELADQGVQIIGLAVDDADTAARFARDYDINYPVLADTSAVMRVQDQLGAGQGLPVTLVIDRRGRIEARAVGEITREGLDEMLAPLLKKP
ncbi:TlpA disulfide reductase family protein [Spectribacter hydrogenoxidans]|uniref:TlpA disulfide reductase family protein n=1 Tax=Spectribacter hydrogenoxidans TaxID=3075608 RepID=A0ABU3C083_9GAMM|nr:TlpA disulfide reductase family protein [Salinisphaera sp. W335]MDT0634981.1 TlpA disulfide reductase family protein [Salinisphaera sp. W335]